MEDPQKRKIQEFMQNGISKTSSGSIEFLSSNIKVGAKGIFEKSLSRENYVEKDQGFQAEDLKVLKRIGNGASSIVCLADYQSKKYALKIINLEDEESCFKNSKTEIECLREIDSQYIVKMHQALIRNRRICILLDYMGCGCLSRALKISKKPMCQKTLSSIAYMVLKSLEYLHERKIVHRDIKPGNLLLEQRGYVKLTDFGLAKKLSFGKCSERVGTFRYMSPEQLLGESYDCSTDIWSFGMTMAELYLGKFPFDEECPHKYSDLLSQSDLWKVSDFEEMESFHDFLCQCTQLDPVARPTASHLLSHPFIKQTSRLFRNQIIGKFISSNNLSTAKHYQTVEVKLQKIVSKIVNHSETIVSRTSLQI